MKEFHSNQLKQLFLFSILLSISSSIYCNTQSISTNHSSTNYTPKQSNSKFHLHHPDHDNDEELTFYLKDNPEFSNSTTAKACFSLLDPCDDIQQIIDFIIRDDDNDELNSSSLLQRSSSLMMKQKEGIINIILIGDLKRCSYDFKNTQDKIHTIRWRSLDGRKEFQSVIECGDEFVQFPFNVKLEMEKLIVRNTKLFMMEQLESVKLVDLSIETSTIKCNGKSIVFVNSTIFGGEVDLGISKQLDMEQLRFESCTIRFSGIDITDMRRNTFLDCFINFQACFTLDINEISVELSQIVLMVKQLTLYHSLFTISSVQIILADMVQFEWLKAYGSKITMIGVKYVSGSDALFTNKSQLGLTTVVQTSLNRCLFEDNENALVLERVGDTQILFSNFTRNMNAIYISGDPIWNNMRKFITCTFNDNWSLNKSIITAENVEISVRNSEFNNNWGINGGVFYGFNSKIILMQNVFVNTSSRIIARCGVNECGNGGIVYLLNSYVYFSNLIVQNSRAMKGGIIYSKGVSEISYSLESSVIIDNVALLSGNLFYLSDDTIFDRGNLSNSELGSRKLVSALWRVDSNQQFSDRTISFYPGQTISLEYVFFDEFYNMFNRTNVTPIIKTNYPSDSIVSIISIEPNSNTMISLFLQVSKNVKNLNISINLPYHEYSFDIEVNILDCPYDYGLSSFSNSNLEICVYKGFTFIIIASLSVFVVILIAIYVLIYIIKRLIKLYKKEKSESNIAKKIIDKQFVFSLNNEKDPLLRLESKVSNITIPIEEIEIIKRIGEGANGTVYLAKWNGNEVALKSLKFERDSEEFENEASLLNSLRHPCIVRFYGIVLSSSTKYMVTEFLNNGSLDKLIYNSKIGKQKLDMKTKIQILKEIASGMNYLHNLRPPCIHRDLKSPNILLDSNLKPKVTDFGLSKITSNSTMTCNIGTALYMVCLDVIS